MTLVSKEDKGRTTNDDLGSNEHDLTKHSVLLASTDRLEICKVPPVDSDILMMIGREVRHINMSTLDWGRSLFGKTYAQH